MRITVDSSAIIEIERRNEAVLRIFKKLVAENHDLFISTISVSEILTGVYLRKDVSQALFAAREILGQFQWVEVDGAVAEKTAQLLAYLIMEKKSVEYQDVVIASTALMQNSDALLTLNKKDFMVFPHLKGKVFAPTELRP